MAAVTVRSTLPPFLTVMRLKPPTARPVRSTVIDAVASSGALPPPLVARTTTSAATMTTTAPASTPMRAVRLMDSSFGRVVAPPGRRGRSASEEGWRPPRAGAGEGARGARTYRERCAREGGSRGAQAGRARCTAEALEGDLGAAQQRCDRRTQHGGQGDRDPAAVTGDPGQAFRVAGGEHALGELLGRV